MTNWEIARLACYVLSAPALLYLALHSARSRLFSYAFFYASQTLLFVWYVVEITIAATGINTREYRVIGTPMVLVMTAAVVAIAGGIWRAERQRNNTHGD